MVSAKRVVPGEIKHYYVFHLGLHCLQKCSFRAYRIKMGKKDKKKKIPNIKYMYKVDF